MTEQVKTIRAEIERRLKELEPYDGLGALSDFSRREELNKLLAFIDAMPEEPASDDLEKAVLEYRKTIGDPITQSGFVAFASFFAAWQRGQMLRERCMYAKDHYTAEDRAVLCDGCEEDCKFNNKED